MQTGQPVETHEDRFLEVAFSTVACLVYSSSRIQKIVSLSSAESETYAAASAVMDAMLIRVILCWILQVRILMYL